MLPPITTIRFVSSSKAALLVDGDFHVVDQLRCLAGRPRFSQRTAHAVQRKDIQLI